MSPNPQISLEKAINQYPFTFGADGVTEVSKVQDAQNAWVLDWGINLDWSVKGAYGLKVSIDESSDTAQLHCRFILDSENSRRVVDDKVLSEWSKYIHSMKKNKSIGRERTHITFTPNINGSVYPDVSEEYFFDPRMVPGVAQVIYDISFPVASQDELANTLHPLLLRNKSIKPRYDKSIKTSLVDAGIPDEAVEANPDTWTFVKSVEEGGIQHTNSSAIIQGSDDEMYFLKVNPHEDRADTEAAANYFLPSVLPELIIPSSTSTAYHAGGLHITVQAAQRAETNKRQRSARGKLRALTEFHSRAGDILSQNGVPLQQFEPREFSDFKNRITQANGSFATAVDYGKLADAITYFKENPQTQVIHGDTKNTNWLGQYLIDLERVSLGDPRVDLLPPLIEEGLSVKQMHALLPSYAQTGGLEATDLVAYLVAVRENCGAALRAQQTGEVDAHKVHYERFLNLNS